jgi:hypothetical protein
MTEQKRTYVQSKSSRFAIPHLQYKYQHMFMAMAHKRFLLELIRTGMVKRVTFPTYHSKWHRESVSYYGMWK